MACCLEAWSLWTELGPVWLAPCSACVSLTGCWTGTCRPALGDLKKSLPSETYPFYDLFFSSDAHGQQSPLILTPQRPPHSGVSPMRGLTFWSCLITLRVAAFLEIILQNPFFSKPVLSSTWLLLNQVICREVGMDLSWNDVRLPFALFLDLGIFRHWFSVRWFRNVWCSDFSSPQFMRAPGRAGVGVAGGLEGGWLPLGFWLQCCVVTSGGILFRCVGPLAVSLWPGSFF